MDFADPRQDVQTAALHSWHLRRQTRSSNWRNGDAAASLDATALVCSAIAETRTTDSLKLSSDRVESEEDNISRWPQTRACLAYTFFSKHAQKYSSVRKLHLANMRMAQTSAMAFALVLLSPEPTLELFGIRDTADGGESDRRRTRWMLAKVITVILLKRNVLDDISAGSASWELTTEVKSLAYRSSAKARLTTMMVTLTSVPLCSFMVTRNVQWPETRWAGSKKEV